MTQICQFLAQIPLAIRRCLRHQARPRHAPKECTVEEAYTKMQKNLEKAFREHRVYTPHFDISLRPLGRVSYHAKTFKGSRDSMEDSHIYQKMSGGILMGVFDGHAGFEVAAFAASYFARHFEGKLAQTKSNVYMAMMHTLFDIQNLVERSPRLSASGSTALVSYIKTDTSEIFTMTLGDSEAFIYRRGEMLPLSCVRNWNCEKDFKRASNGRYRAIFLSQPFGVMHPREWRYGPMTDSLEYGGINLSRSIGDRKYDAISHKPKITRFLGNPGDVLVLACDGLIDYLPKNKMVDAMAASLDNPAEALFESMLHHEDKEIDKKRGDSPDNCTILSLQIYTVYQK